MRCSIQEIVSLQRDPLGASRKPLLALLACLLAAALGGAGCSNVKHDEYCEQRNGTEQKPPTCRSLEEMQRDFRYWDGVGEVISVDDGPRETLVYRYQGSWAINCCYNVTHRGGGS